jgi:hypothetical protein
MLTNKRQLEDEFTHVYQYLLILIGPLPRLLQALTLERSQETRKILTVFTS